MLAGVSPGFAARPPPPYYGTNTQGGSMQAGSSRDWGVPTNVSDEDWGVMGIQQWGAASANVSERDSARMSVMSTGPIKALLFHVHKAGGSSICNLAGRNHEYLSQANCNLDDYTKFGFNCDRYEASAWSADAQRSYLSSVFYSFGADECLAPREAVPDLLTLTALREPLERMRCTAQTPAPQRPSSPPTCPTRVISPYAFSGAVDGTGAASHYYYDLHQSPNQLHVYDTRCTSFDCFVLHEMGNDDYSKYYWQNYMTRFFSGTAHTDTIGEGELERAKARLGGVQVLIDLANYEASMATLREKLPSWSDTSLPYENHAGGGLRTVELSPEAHAKLSERNKLDLELYEHFHLLATLQRERRRGEQTLEEHINQTHAPESLELAFYNDSIRIVVTRSPEGGIYS
jgi:hypothetical protein